MSYTSLLYHIVFSTKERRPLFKRGLRDRTIRYIGGVTRELNGQLLKAGGADDHLHVAATIHPTIAVADFIGKIKAAATGWIHKTFDKMSDFWWQDGYAAFSVSPSVMAKVKEYIAAQEEHHKKVTFQEELIALLEKHGLQYDERHIWT